jgi:hypothetical protein
LPYLVFAIAITILAILVAVSPETALISSPVPRYRPQRIAVPRASRGTFFAATGAGIAAFAVFGVFNSLVPGFLVGTMHQSSHAFAGAVAFAAFAAGAAAQIVLARWDTRAMLRRSIPILAVGLGLFSVAMWIPNVVVFVIGGVVTGAGVGLLFRAAMVTAGGAAAPEARAEVLAGFFLGAYVGLSVPVIGLGIATLYWPAREVMLVFVALVLAAVIVAVVRLTRRSASKASAI